MSSLTRCLFVLTLVLIAHSQVVAEEAAAVEARSAPASLALPHTTHEVTAPVLDFLSDPANQQRLAIGGWNIGDSLMLSTGPRFSDEERRAINMRTLYMMGSRYFRLQQWDEALQVFENALDYAPQHPAVLKMLARCYLKLGNPLQTIVLIETVLAADDTAVPALLIKAEALRELGQVPGSIATLKRAQKLQPRNMVTLDALAESYRLAGDLDGMIEVYEQIVSIEPGNLRALFFLSWTYMFKGDVDKAIHYIDEALRRFPTNTQLHARKVEMLRQARRQEPLRQALRQAILDAADPTAFVDELQRGAQRGRRQGGAIAEFEEFLSEHPLNVRVRMTLAELYEEAGRLADALEQYSTVADEHEDNASAHYARGRLLVRLDRFDEAIEAFKMAQRFNPFDATRYLEIGQLLVRKAEYREALEYLQQGLAIDPRNPELAVWVARTLRDEGRPAESIEVVHQAMELVGDHPLLHTELALSHRRLGDLQTSRHHLERSIALDRSNPRTWQWMFETLLDLDDHTGATEAASIIARDHMTTSDLSRDMSYAESLVKTSVRHGRFDLTIMFIEAAARDPQRGLVVVSAFLPALRPKLRNDDFRRDMNALRQRVIEAAPKALVDRWDAEFLAAMGQIDEAIAALERARRLMPNDPLSYTRLMQLYGQTANVEGLNRTLAAAQGIFQARPLVLFELEYAVQLREAGQPEETLRLIRERLAGPPLDFVLTAYLYRVMGDTLAHLNRYEEAYEAYEQALALLPDDILTLNNYGYLLATRGEHLDKAEVMVKRALANAPDQGFILDSLGWIYYQKGDIEQAIRYLEAAVERDATHPELHEHLGDAYRRAGRLADAVESWRRSLDMDATNREDIEARIAEVEAELAIQVAP